MIRHVPVLLEETLAYWHHKKGGTYVDATAGLGGHSEALLKKDPKARLIALDCDPAAVLETRRRLAKYGGRVSVVHENFSNLPAVLERDGIGRVDGIHADLGFSSLQVEDASRGFSFRQKGPLDMRMDPSQGETALDMIARLSAEELARFIRTLGEEPFAARIAWALKEAAERHALSNTLQCADIVHRVVPARGETDSATRTFQALRIAVNHELDHLRDLLDFAHALLERGGRLVLIAFHSLEDRMVKTRMRRWEQGCTCPNDFPQCVCGKESTFEILTRRAVRPSPEEARANPRSRSARLRAAACV